MKKMLNTVTIVGRVYEHKLAVKVAGDNSKNPGVEFINGTLSVATDDECLNVVQVHYTYVTAVTKNGSANATYNTLKAIIDGKIGSVMNDGIENAGFVKCDTNIDLNEFYSDRNGKEELVSAKRNEGGFVHQINASEVPEQESARSAFKADMVITRATRLEEDEERDLPERMIIKGAVFNFRGALLPVEFTVLHPQAMNYFENLEISSQNPVFTQVAGKQISQTIVQMIEEESAFGEPAVRERRTSKKDWVVTWAKAEPYLWDDESTILASELSEAMANREIELANIKTRQDEYKNSKGNAFATAPAKKASPAKQDYNF